MLLGRFKFNEEILLPIIKTKNLNAINLCSHSFLSKTPKQKVYILNEYYQMNPHMDPFYVFNIVQQKLDNMTFDNIQFSSFHIKLRNINESFIKKLFYWTLDNNHYPKFVHLANAIKSKSTNYVLADRTIVPSDKISTSENIQNPYFFELKLFDLSISL
jgi:hypothetical protein